MIIWVIEDIKECREAANRAINKATAKTEVQAEVSEFADFKVPQEAPSSPDIVIMDLYLGSDDFKGETVYKNLRKSNVAQNSFVIVWSGYRGFAKAEKFVEACVHERFSALNNKSEGDLEMMLTDVFERIKRENEDIQ